MLLKVKYWNFLQKIIIFVMLFAMISIWPLCLVRRETENRSGDQYHLISEEMTPGTVVTQSFRARERYLETVDFVLTFDEDAERKGSLLFELLSEDGEVLQSVPLNYEIISNGAYFRICTERKVKKNGVYQYRLTNVDITENLPRVMYTGEEAMYAVNNCGFTWNQQKIDGEALSRYHWKAPLDPCMILACWGILGIVGFTFFEIMGNIKKK